MTVRYARFRSSSSRATTLIMASNPNCSCRST